MEPDNKELTVGSLRVKMFKKQALTPEELAFLQQRSPKLADSYVPPADSNE